LPVELRIGESSKAHVTVSPSDVLPLR
jgi:hypothetical protein